MLLFFCSCIILIKYVIYEGRSINKLQNDIILLIFKIWTFGNILFVGNLIGDIYRNFYDDDVINVMSLVSQCSILPSRFRLQLASAEQNHELSKKSEQVQQANVFKRQALVFHFSRYCPNSCKHLFHHTPVWPHEGIDRCNHCSGRQNNTATRFFLNNNTFMSMSKLFTPNMYCWSCKILVTIYWTHLRLTGICTISFCPQQTNNRRLFFVG